MSSARFQKAYKQASALCARSEHCRRDISERLRRSELSRDEIEALLDRLEDEGFINHERYAQAFVSDKFRFAHWGRLKIRAALMQKGIPSDLITAALSEKIDDEEYLASLRHILQKGKPSLALSRGYEPHLVYDNIPTTESTF